MNSAGTPPPRMLVGSIAIDLMDQEAVLELILGSLEQRGPLAVVSANLDHIHHFANDPAWASLRLATSVKDSEAGLRWLTLLDGIPLVQTAKALSGRDWPKLSGSDLIYPILELAASKGLRVGFLGGDAETHAKLQAQVGVSLPEIDIAGAWTPSRPELSDPSTSRLIADQIREAHVEILVVGLGKPRQEEWIARYGPDTGAHVLLAFGAVADFLAGRVQRAPERVSAVGAEWAWRLALEPRRLARRYLIQGPPAWMRLKRTARIVTPVVSVMSRDQVRGNFLHPGEHADVAVVVVTYNSALDILELIDDLRAAAAHRAIRLVIVDNQSSDDTVDIVRAHDDVMLIVADGNLGYSGGINAALPHIGPADQLLILNPDLRLAPEAVARLLSATERDRVGAVVPLMLDEDDGTYPSLRREPSLTRALGDALLGGKVRRRPGFSSEIDARPQSYLAAHQIDWATGAALMIPTAVANAVGDWNEDFFLYSEETDYCRRIREAGYRVIFEPTAVVQHRGSGSGTSPALATLMAVNRVRYVEFHHGRTYAALFRSLVALSELLRSYNRDHRRTLGIVLDRTRWRYLPQATKLAVAVYTSGPHDRGAVIIPAYNEATIIKRTLDPLSRLASQGYIELIVVCNGCTDDTADVARSVAGVRVIELEQGSKPAALNAGDGAATSWPRIYLDADIQLNETAALALLDRLGKGDKLVARPSSTYNTDGASAMVRSYYRARRRVWQHHPVMWGAGVYGLTEQGHQRFGAFPAITGDDFFVDTRFDAAEKVVVPTDPAVVTTPVNTKNLLAILRRARRGNTELIADEKGGNSRACDTGPSTARAVIATIRGPLSAIDAFVYVGMAFAARCRRRTSAPSWERDESSRSGL